MVHVKHLACVATFAAATASVSAGPVFNLNIEFSGASPPAGTAPWMTVTFTQPGGAGVVLMTLENNLVGTEFVGQFVWNAKPTNVPLPGALTITHDPSSDPGTAPSLISKKATNPGAGGGFSLYKPDGDGFFDFHIAWVNGVFTGTEKAVFKITGTGVLASWFDDFSEPAQGGGPGPFHAAAHVQGIGPSGANSGWIGDGPIIPLPTTAGMAFAGLLGLGCIRRRRAL